MKVFKLILIIIATIAGYVVVAHSLSLILDGKFVFTPGHDGLYTAITTGIKNLWCNSIAILVEIRNRFL